MPLVTLTTDLGTSDYYVGVLKGELISRNEDLRLIDITHNVRPYNIIEGAHALRSSWKRFPEGSIHILAVNTLENNGRFLLISHKGHYFIGPDNGVFSLLFPEGAEFIYVLGETEGNQAFAYASFFAEGIAMIENKELADLRQIQNIRTFTGLQPIVQQDMIRATIAYIDHYDNAMVNVSRQLFEETRLGRDFEIIFNRNIVRELSNTYADVPEGEKLCLFNSSGMLEIAMNKGKASSLLGLSLGGTVLIDFS